MRARSSNPLVWEDRSQSEPSSRKPGSRPVPFSRARARIFLAALARAVSLLLILYLTTYQASPFMMT